MAQSLMTNKVCSSSLSIESKRALSWLTDLSKWHFHAIVHSFPFWQRYIASSWSSSLMKVTLLTSFSISSKVDSRPLHSEHLSPCTWSQDFFWSFSAGSPRAYTLLWLGTLHFSLMWTYKKQRETYTINIIHQFLAFAITSSWDNPSNRSEEGGDGERVPVALLIFSEPTNFCAMYEQYRGEEVHRGHVFCQMLAAFHQILLSSACWFTFSTNNIM